MLSKLHPLRAKRFIAILTWGISRDKSINIFNNLRKEKTVRFCSVNEMILGNVNLDKELKFLPIQPNEPAGLVVS